MGGERWKLINDELSFNTFCSIVIGSWGQVGVLLFVIITSWYMCEREPEIHSRSIGRIYGVVYFWNILLGIIMYGLGVNKVSTGDIIQTIIVPWKSYWYISTYTGFLVCMPMLQRGIKDLNATQMREVCIGAIFLWSWSLYIGNMGAQLGEFCCVFMIVATLKKQKNNFIERNRTILFGLSAILEIIVMIVRNILGNYFDWDAIPNVIANVHTSRHILVFLNAMSGFYIFKYFKMGNNKYIDMIASTTFGIYIIHGFF